jgi:hypothetical protein
VHAIPASAHAIRVRVFRVHHLGITKRTGTPSAQAVIVMPSGASQARTPRPGGPVAPDLASEETHLGPLPTLVRYFKKSIASFYGPRIAWAAGIEVPPSPTARLPDVGEDRS